MKSYEIADTRNLSIASKLNDSRSQKQTNYQSNEYERDSAEKQIQRDKILRFSLDNHDDLNPRYIGLPGKYWIFERSLIQEKPKTNIFGVEKDFNIFLNSCGYLPGKAWVRRQVFPYGIDKRLAGIEGRTQGSIAIEMAQTSTGMYVCGDLQSITDKKIITQGGGRSFYGKVFKNRTLVWYDFTSSFNINTYISIHNIKHIINPHQKAVICLTLQYGRDQLFNGAGEEARVEIVKRALPEFECLDVWKYKGFNKTTMINICGIINKIE